MAAEIPVDMRRYAQNLLLAMKVSISGLSPHEIVALADDCWPGWRMREAHSSYIGGLIEVDEFEWRIEAALSHDL